MIPINSDFPLSNKRVCYLPSESIKSLLLDLSVTLPRYLYQRALAQTLKQYYENALKTESVSKLLPSNNHFTHLSDFPIQLLKKQLPKRMSLDLLSCFYEALWRELTHYLIRSGIDIEFIRSWAEYEVNQVDDETYPVFEPFIQSLEPLMKDQEQHCDGVPLDTFKAMLMEFASHDDLDRFAETYAVSLPKSLRKNEYKMLLKAALDAENLLNESTLYAIESGTYKDLEKIATKQNVTIKKTLDLSQKVESLSHTINRQESTLKKIESDVMVSIHKNELKALKKRITHLERHANEKTKELNDYRIMLKTNKRPRGNTLRLAFSVVLIFFAVGLITYVLQDVGFVQTINAIFNAVSIGEKGVMEHYHAWLETWIGH